jgi:hypothetical protein
MSIANRLGAAVMAASLVGGCAVAPYGAQVLLVRTQQSYDEVFGNCEAGDQTACAVRPFVAKALAQARQDARPPWL